MLLRDPDQAARGTSWLALALLTTIVAIAPYATPLVGLVVLIGAAAWSTYVARILGKGGELIRTLTSRYGALTRHGDKLGMQAVIGADLRALLLGWMPTGKSSEGKAWQTTFRSERPFWWAGVFLVLLVPVSITAARRASAD